MKITLMIMIFINLYANVKQDMLSFYQNKKYNKVCNVGFENLANFTKDEEFILLYGFGCLKSDNIDRLNSPISMLKYSKEARSNAAYFSVILMQKKLLLHSLVDEYDLSILKLPTTNYTLSKVFDIYSKIGKHKKRSFYLFEDKKDKKLTYKLYLLKHKSQKAIVIEEYYDNTMIKNHIYW